MKTRVIFRKWKDGGVIALFPDEVERNGMVDSYEHHGQHGSADLGIVRITKAASPHEYAPLKRELESAPFHYDLKVVKRATRARRSR
jgi:hypothetical protein